MFDEIRYELNSMKIDRNGNVEIISTIKNMYLKYVIDKEVV